MKALRGAAARAPWTRVARCASASTRTRRLLDPGGCRTTSTGLERFSRDGGRGARPTGSRWSSRSRRFSSGSAPRASRSLSQLSDSSRQPGRSCSWTSSAATSARRPPRTPTRTSIRRARWLPTRSPRARISAFGSLRPMFDTALAHGGGVFVLALTSNPEGAAVQRAAVADGRTVAQTIIDEISAGQRGCRAAGQRRCWWSARPSATPATISRRRATARSSRRASARRARRAGRPACRLRRRSRRGARRRTRGRSSRGGPASVRRCAPRRTGRATTAAAVLRHRTE